MEDTIFVTLTDLKDTEISEIFGLVPMPSIYTYRSLIRIVKLTSFPAHKIKMWFEISSPVKIIIYWATSSGTKVRTIVTKVKVAT